jgi:hypothetical protein
MAVSKESLIYSYIFTFTLLMVVMTNATQYFAFHRPRKQDWWGCWGPTVLMAFSTVLLLVSPLKNLVVNVCMASFRANGFDSTIEHTLDIAYIMDSCGEETPLLVNKADPGIRSLQARESQLAGSGSFWDALGPITSAVVCLPVLLAH